MSEIITPNKTIVDYKSKKKNQLNYQKSKAIAFYVLYLLLMKSMKVE